MSRQLQRSDSDPLKPAGLLKLPADESLSSPPSRSAAPVGPLNNSSQVRSSILADWLVPSPKSDRFLRAPEAPDELGRLGNYRVLKLLGQGGMAYVFLAEDIGLRRCVALKVMKPALESDPAAGQRFIREARTLASIRHENVVTVYQVGQEGATAFMAMECLQGQTLDMWVDANGCTDLGLALRLGREIAAGLDVIHRNGLIHRDLKPNNIWVEEPDRRIKLLDFGLARPVDDKLHFTRSGFVMGTPAFMSPEQARGDELDPRSDLFALGGVLYFLCCGALPFRSGSTVGMLTAVALDRPQPIGKLNPRLPKAAAALIMQLLAKNAADRPSSAQEVIARLQALEPAPVAARFPTPINNNELESATQPMRTAAARDAPKKPVRRWRRPLAIVALFAVLATGSIVAPWQRNHANEGGTPSAAIPEAKEQPIGDRQPIPVVAAPAAKPSGLLILDNCDPATQNKRGGRDNLTLLDSSGKQKFRMSGFDACDTIACARLIAPDLRRGCIWVYENAARRIRKFDLAGAETLAIPDVDGSAIAVDPETGNVWALTGREGTQPYITQVYNERGQAIAKHDVGGWDLAYDPQAKAFWIAGTHLTKIAAATGKVAFSTQIATCFAVSVDVDPKSGAGWVTVRQLFDGGKDKQNRLLKFDGDGQKLADIALGEKRPFRVTVDPTDGSVWVAHMRKSVERFSSDGRSLAVHPVEALSVQADHAGGVWVATPTEVQQLAADGKVTNRANHAGRTTQAWLAVLK